VKKIKIKVGCIRKIMCMNKEEEIINWYGRLWTMTMHLNKINPIGKNNLSDSIHHLSKTYLSDLFII
jgi:hypothetical protein